MHKKLKEELVSLAHSILQLKNIDEAVELKEKARVLYEKLSVLSYIENQLNTTPDIPVSKEKAMVKNENTIAETNPEKVITNTSDSEISPETKGQSKPTESTSGNDEDIFEPKFDSVRIDIESLKSNQISSKEEFRDAISADKTSTLFDDSDSIEEGRKSLNDKLSKNIIQVGLNDRIAFVNNLFNYNQSEFNRVLSQLNTFKTYREAVDFITSKVKPEYDWSEKEDYEERLIALIERKFS